MKKLFKYLPSKVFRLGEGSVTRYTLIEIKWLFSIYIHHISTPGQDRFHTHAFNSLVYIYSGGYVDEIKEGIGKDKPIMRWVFSAGQFRYIPRLMNHRLTLAQPDTISILITGSYSNLWTEETNEGTFRLLTKGRTPLIEFKEK